VFISLYLPWELEQEISCFIDYYYNERYHESLDDVTPADAYYGKRTEVLTRREKIKERTLKARKEYNLSQAISQEPSLSENHVLST
jgi:hypothetical protein